jgi:hypothetical protein
VRSSGSALTVFKVVFDGLEEDWEQQVVRLTISLRDILH